MLDQLTPVFHPRVGAYMLNSPTLEQKNCLREFFKKLARGEANNRHVVIGDIMLVEACEHIIHFKQNGKKVEEILPFGAVYEAFYKNR